MISLQPDLVIANKEENVKDQVAQLAIKFPVWLTDVNTLKEGLQMIIDIGVITGTQVPANNMVKDIKTAFGLLQQSPVKAAYLIWQNPFMAPGGDTFISDMMLHSGFTNVFAAATRYPEVTIDDIKESGCELLLLSSEPYPFTEKHQKQIAGLLPGIKVMLSDGEMFSWYGSRMLQAPAYFEKLYAEFTAN